MSRTRIQAANRDADSTQRAAHAKSGSLLTAGIAGALASACCIGPLLLASIGLGSVAAGVVALFEPLRPAFIVIALAALAVAGWYVYRRPVQVRESGTACAAPQTERKIHRVYSAAFWVVTAIVLALLTFPYYISLLL